MKIRLGRMLRDAIAGANIVSVMLMGVTGHAFIVDPAEHPTLSILTFAFPAFLLICLMFMIFWVFFKPRFMFISAVGFLLCFIPLRAYVPFNFGQDSTDDCIKVLSFNVMYFQGLPEQNISKDDNQVVQYIIESGADIVCLQEGNRNQLSEGERNRLNAAYPYHTADDITPHSRELPVLSKYPIVAADTISYATVSNHSVAYTLLDGEDTIYVVNCHLESNKFTKEDKDEFSQFMHGKKEGDAAKEESRSVIRRLAENAALRAPQADAVSQFVKDHEGCRIIVCGDFNDTPNSYARHTVADGLRDCYIQSAKGPGWSYAKNAMRVRIDNILCSQNYKPVKCFVDTKVALSDHFPIVSYIKKQ